ncbi:MAG: molecular chaperone HtpG [Candidatus Heimdallarchaeota archaeon]|nr:molecular chaperone HtpG [Candidatus Heimdallarchaeota archaeon]
MSENTFEFKSDTQKVLRIIVHSLYQKKEVFLRELLSNASDALNKVRIRKLTNEEVYDAERDLEITIISDKNTNTLTIRDTGIGMTRDELERNLGTIAQSGTEEFLKAMEDENSKDLIGQFGVGFYSGFLVSSEIEVISRSAIPGNEAYKWHSTGEESFTIEPAEKEERGTDIILYLKEDEHEYLDSYMIKNLVKEYSNYIEFPIKLHEVKEIKEEDDLPLNKEEAEEEEEKEDEVLNEQTALWRVSPRELEKKEKEQEEEYTKALEEAGDDAEKKPIKPESEYKKFYNQNLGEFGDYLAKIHVRVESPSLFYALLYIPETKNKMFNARESDWGIKLYNRKILIDDKNKDILPEYMRFMLGVVDAEDFDLNVSREVVQSSRMQRQMKNYLTKKILSTLEDMAKDDPERYIDFFREFGPFLKEGIASNDKYKDRLTELLRFHSTHEDGKDGSASLKQYTERMKEGQDTIYYLSGFDLETLKKSPHLEYYEKEGYEVLLLGEAIDSFLMMHLHDYEIDGEGDEKKKLSFHLIDQEEVDDKDEEESKDDDEEDDEDGDKKKERKGPYGKLLDKFATVLGGSVSDVKTSDRMVSAVARLVTPKGGMSSDLQRAMKIMESQSGTPGMGGMGMFGKILQINPEHEIIQKLKAAFEKDPDSRLVELIIHQIHDNCRLADGDVPDFNKMTKRSEEIMALSLKK